MEFGTRTIRSAGQGSGSVEVTLPASFRDLTGVPCRLALRDGLRPELVLQPDLRPAQAAFTSLWAMLRGALDAEAAAMPALADAVLTLWPVPSHPGGPPRLAWHDGLLLAGPPPHEATMVARCVAGLAHLLARPLGIDPSLAAGFGAAAGFALTGRAAVGAEADMEIGATPLEQARIRPGDAFAASGDALSPGFAEAARPALILLRDAHLEWTADPARHAALRAAWRRGVALELMGN
jgi:hypothetical protein